MKKILVVDDDEQLRKVICKGLKRAGYEVAEAADGAQALKLFNEHPSDIIVTDLIMPEKEGIELIISLRDRHPPVKIIAMSGGGRNAPGNYLSVAKALGAYHTLAKPFNIEELLMVIETALVQ